ncbi:MAG: fibronectin type III domain-containing protein, partial [Candidatus Aenigmatarchaeota archaeon]
PDGMPGNCLDRECVPGPGCTSNDDCNEIKYWNNGCYEDGIGICSGGICSYDNLKRPEGSSCHGIYHKGFCNADGLCVQCLSDSHCTHPPVNINGFKPECFKNGTGKCYESEGRCDYKNLVNLHACCEGGKGTCMENGYCLVGSSISCIKPPCSKTETKEVTCNDFVDNDCDIYTDCSDPDCKNATNCIIPECASDEHCTSPPNTQCYEGQGRCSNESCVYTQKSPGTSCVTDNTTGTCDENGICIPITIIAQPKPEPTCSFISTPGTYVNSTTLQYRWTGKDATTGYELRWVVKDIITNESKEDSLYLPGANNKSWTITARNNQRIEIWCRARYNDIVGNWSTSAVTLVDTEKPTVSIIIPTQNTVASVNNNLLIKWTGTDIASGIERYQIHVSDGATSLINTTDTEYNLPVSQGQTYRFKIRAIDRAGNIGDWSEEKSAYIKGNFRINWSLIPSSIIKIGSDIKIIASISSNIDLSDIQWQYDGENITFNKTEISSKAWNATWHIVNPKKAKDQALIISVKNMQNEIAESATTFSVVECIPPENISCCNGERCMSEDYLNTICTYGIQSCTPDYEWGVCSGVKPVKEICDGYDNDCDGNVDEDVDCSCMPGEQRLVCPWGYCNTMGMTEGVFKAESWCKAKTQICVNSRWSTSGGRGPETEVCNGIDDDCDGVVDNNAGCCNEGEEQTFGLANEDMDGIGICRLGQKVCKNGKWEVNVQPITPILEVCNNNVDDDCDGKVDKQDDDCRGMQGMQEFPWWMLTPAGGGMFLIFALWSWLKRKKKESDQVMF